MLVQAAALANLVLDVKVAGFNPGVEITDNVPVLHHGGVGEHLVHSDPLVPAVGPQHLLGDLDGVHYAVEAVPSLHHVAKLAGRELAELQELVLKGGDY